MGYPDEESRGALRISLGRTTTQADIDAAVVAVPRSLAMLRMGAAAIAADPLGQAIPAGAQAG
jgi:cysteine desulfurase